MALFDWIIGLFSDPFFIFSLIFWIFCYILVLYLRKKKPKSETAVIGFPFYAIFRTKKLNNWLKKIGEKYQKFWRIFFTIGIFVAFGFVFFSIYFFVNNLLELINAPKIENAIQPLIPGVTVEFPIFSYFVIPLLLCITAHEFSHAVAATADKCKVKSTGILMAGLFYIILPGAFVEPDDFEIESEKTSVWTRLRIFSAGSFINSIQALIGILLIINFTAIISPLYGPQVFKVEYVVPDYEGGYNFENIYEGDIVLEINGTSVNLRNNKALSDFLENETEIKCAPGDNLDFKVRTANNDIVHREIILGHHLFIGFTINWYNDNEFNITQIYNKYQGGNNYETLENIESNMTFKEIDGYSFNVSENKTLGTYLRNHATEKMVNLTRSDGFNYSIYIDYFPTVLGAYELRNYFTGAFFTINNENQVVVESVLSNLVENGINDDNLFKGDIITHINGNEIIISDDRTFEDNLIEYIGLIDGEMKINITIIPNSNNSPEIRQINLMPIPKSYVFIGIQSSGYWLPKNQFASLIGNNFMIWLERELLYFYMIAFSVTLFNMLPVLFGIFPTDGLYLAKEIIGLIVGKKIEKGRNKKVNLQFNPENSQYKIEIQRITEIINVQFKISEDKYDLVDSMLYKQVDTINDGYIDTLEFDLQSRKNPPKGTQMEVELKYNEDVKEKTKKIISLIIGLGIFGIVLANFILSFVNIGNVTFWL